MAAFPTLSSIIALFGFCSISVCAYRLSPDPENTLATNQTAVVIAIGGYSHVSPMNTMEIYSLTSNSHVKNGTIPGRRNSFGSAIFNNTIYIVGGWDHHAYQDTFWSYDIVKNTWKTDLPAVPSALYASAAVEVGGRMYVLGGLNQDTTPLTKVYAYETRLRKWYTLDTPIPQTSAFPCAVAQEKHLYYMPEGSLYHSDDGAKSWQKLSSPSEARAEAACVAVGNDAILLAGGSDSHNKALNTVEMYNITTDKWTTVASMLTPRFAASAELMLPNRNDVLICGGDATSNGGHNAQKTCEIYDWKNNKWSKAGFEMEQERESFGLFVTQVNM